MLDLTMNAIVTAPVAAVYEGMGPDAPLCDELLCGTAAAVLEEAGGWLRVRAAHNYTGWTRAETACRDPATVSDWQREEKLLVTGLCADLQGEPSVRAPPLMTLLRGSLVVPAGEPDRGWVPVRAAGGLTGWLPAAHLCPYPLGAGMPEAAQRRSICAMARSYLGCCYRWGGKTPLGIDCSGFTSQVFLNHGIITYRDSPLQEGFAVRAIPAERLRPADLLYWKGHIGLYLGAGRYIHANATAGCVSINSLRPGAPGCREDLAASLSGWGTVF